MPRTGERKTLNAAGTSRSSGFTVESAAAAATVDVTDAQLNTNFGITADTLSVTEFVDDFKLARVPIATSGDEAAKTIAIGLVERNAGDDGFTVNFTATAAASKKVGVRVTQL